MTPFPTRTSVDDTRDALPADGTQVERPAGGLPPTTPGQGMPWSAWLAWLVIAGIVGLIVYRNTMRKATVDVATEIVTMQLQARYIVGAASLNLPGASGKALYSQVAATLDRGSYSERLRFCVLAGELVGPDEALKKLRQLEKERRAGDIEARELSVEAVKKLEKLQAGYSVQQRQHEKEKADKQAEPLLHPVLSEEDQEWLHAHLGWFGDLALAPEGSDPVAREQVLAPARRTVFVYFCAVGLGVVGLCLGACLLLVFGVMAVLGVLHGGLMTGPGRGFVYAETFALYLVLFIGMSYAAHFIPLKSGNLVLGLSGLVMFLSLIVLGWPCLRGIPWRQVRQDLGLHLGEQPLMQVLFGPTCYLCALPLLFVGTLITLALMYAQKQLGWGDPFKPGGGPSHPIIGDVVQGNVWTWVQVFLVACVAAPIVEEIMFRGVLYRHLRALSAGWGRGVSIGVSVLASSFIFAVIHPQGLVAVPVLMSLAIAFALAREWRQSLVSSMIAHGINNGVTMLLLLLAVA